MGRKSKSDKDAEPALPGEKSAAGEKLSPDMTPPPSKLTRFRQLLFRPRIMFLAAMGLVLFNVAPVLKSFLPDLNKEPEYRLRSSQIEVTQPPHWVPHDLIEQVLEHADLPHELSLLDNHLAQEVAEAFQLHPWVEEVVSVRKSFPAKLTVQLTYRKPVAMVQVKQGMYPIDGASILLPPADFSVADTKLYPVITNVRSTPQGPAGTPWGDSLVAGGAKLAEALGPHWKKLQLTAIDCQRPAKPVSGDDDSFYVLVAQGGSRILWGRGPGSDNPGELTTEQKIGRLQKYLADFGSFSRPHGPYEIDIRLWQEISRRPLAAAMADDDDSRR